MKTMTKSLLLSLAVLGLAACSDSGGDSTSTTADDDGSNNGQNDPTARVERVEGPMDAAQQPVSEQVSAQLADGAAGTPLEPAVLCTDQAVTYGALDIVDAVLVALQSGAENMDPQTALENGSMEIQAAAEQFVADLENLLIALAESHCSTAPGSDDGGGDDGNDDGMPGADNPLAGTPLAPLGAALAPVLGQFPSSGGGDGETADLQALSDFFSALNQAFQDGLSQIPPEAKEAPLLGGVLTTLEVTLNDLDALIFTVSIFDEAGTTENLQTTTENVLVNVLTQVVPVAFLEEQAGRDGEFTSRIKDAVAQIVAPMSELQAVFDPLFNQLLGDALQPLIEPIGNQVLPALLDPLTEAISSGGDGGDGGGPTGTPIDQIIALVTDAFGGDDGGTTVDLPLITASLDITIGGESDPAAEIRNILSQLQESAPAP